MEVFRKHGRQFRDKKISWEAVMMKVEKKSHKFTLSDVRPVVGPSIQEFYISLLMSLI